LLFPYLNLSPHPPTHGVVWCGESQHLSYTDLL